MSKVKFNISNAHVAVKTKDTEGNVKYEEPIAVPGSVSVSLEAQGETSSFYADGIVYYKSSANSGYEGEWEMALVPDVIREKILKEAKDSNNVMLETINVEGTEFAFGFQIDGDVKNTRFWFYNCTASRPAAAGKTIENKKDPQTESLKISATAEQLVDGSDDYYVRAKTTDETDETKYKEWFKSVYIPVLAKGGTV